MQTVVTFSLRVPVAAPMTEESASLDRLLEVWRSMKGVAAVRVEWNCLPSAVSHPLIAYVEASVDIEGGSHKDLRKLYERLSREASKEYGRLASRTCSLTDMFE
jgi:hypothetical protein